MNQKKNMGFGFRGWMLIASLFLGFVMFQVFSNFTMNILSDFYGGTQRIAMLYTIATMVGIVIQIVLSRFIGKIKSVKKMAAFFGVISLICAYLIAALPLNMLSVWYVVYFIENVVVTIYALFAMSIIAGQWFPRRKGTVMGIATIAYPFVNGVIGLFANVAYAPIYQGASTPAVFKAYLPFLVAVTIGFLIFLIFVTDYPEQCGCFRDNDKSFTKEAAQAMLEEEIENKRTTVWTTGHIFTNRDFWFAAVSCGLILMCAVGTMAQSNAIISSFPELNYTIIMMMVAVFGAIGSWLLGVLDTRFGTKRAMLLTVALMVISGILGTVACVSSKGAFLIISMILLAMFMGASSNFTVSVAVQYWRREDFTGVFACVNPIANIFNALAPTVVAALLASAMGVTSVFIFITIAGIIGLLLMIAFSGSHVRDVDNKYRAAAGKPLDDALAGRK